MAYLHKFYLVVSDTDFTYPTVINNGLVMDIKKNNTMIASYVKAFVTSNNEHAGLTYIYGESVTDDEINVALGDTITVDIRTIPSIGHEEHLTSSFITADDLTVSNIALGSDVSGVATVSDVNAAGNAIISLLDGTTPLQV